MAKRFFTNRDGNTLMKEFQGVLTNNPNIKNLDSVVGFLRASGYFELRPFLDSINKVRILIGIDVDKYIVKANNAGTIFLGAEESFKEEYLERLRKDIEHSRYSKEVEDGIRQMAEDIASGKLELRAHPSKKIHAKIYLLYPDNFNEYSMGAVITGSSNLSGNGLGISKELQYEFNVKLTDYEDVQGAKEEFEKLWDEANGCPIEAIDVDATIKTTYLKGDVSPYEIYIKMLMEYFSDRKLEINQGDAFDIPPGYSKLEYQIDAVVEGYQKLIKYDGFFLADVVGLGKTVVAAMIAKKFCIDNGFGNTKILVVYPPAVENNWISTFRDFGLFERTEFIPNGSLDKIINENNVNYSNAGDFDLILVDEAHKFRTHTTSQFNLLQEICKMPRINQGSTPGFRKKVMLISATPMNNSPADIYNQILLFQDPRRCTIDGVTNLTNFFSPLIVEFKKLRAQKDYDLPAFKKLAEKVRDRIIKPITVRRTRSDIESIPRYNKDLNGFPKVAPPVKNTYELSNHVADLFEETMDILMNKLNYARYQAIAFLKEEKSKGLYENAELISRSLAGIRKNGLVKRLESSFYAFKISIANFKQANQNMIDMFNNDCVFIAPDLDINKLYEQNLSNDEIEEKINQKAENSPKNSKFHAADFNPNFKTMLEADQAVLNDLCQKWNSVGDQEDSKFAKFKDLLDHELFKTSKNLEQKLVVFSESLDTVEYLKKRIGRKDVLVISSENRNQLFTIIRENFDANYAKEHKNNFNIIITTDVLAEGVNLHRSNIIVNYDTPWNSTKLMQRIGRVNRIGSKSKNIYNYVFYPSRQGNQEINLNKIALSKIQTFHTTFGEDNQIYSTEEIIDRDLDKLFDIAIKTKEEVNQELPFYEELRNLYQNNRKEYNRISKISLRSRTGRNSITVEGVTLDNDTLVFLKTNHRKIFYRIGETSTEQLSSIEAMKFFKATKEEIAKPRIEDHHNHVQKAIEKFTEIKYEEFAASNLNAQQINAGAQISIALNLLNTFLPFAHNDEELLHIQHLKANVENGVIAFVARRLEKLHKELSRGKMSRDQVQNEIFEMAKKYDAYFIANESLKQESESEPEIVLSESFS